MDLHFILVVLLTIFETCLNLLCNTFSLLCWFYFFLNHLEHSKGTSPMDPEAILGIYVKEGSIEL